MPEWIPGALMGAAMGLVLVKLGNPAILHDYVDTPRDAWELLFAAWPLEWGNRILALLLGGAVLVLLAEVRAERPLRWSLAPGWPWVGLPLFWLAWQGVAALDTVDPTLTRVTLFHFAKGVFCLYVGAFALSRLRRAPVFWGVLAAAFGWVLWAGINQRFGGLEEMRRMIYAQPGWESYPTELLARIGRDRVFATLFYPNALAGAILLLYPALMCALTRATCRWRGPVRVLFLAAFTGASLGCLYWSGSKAGWLIAVIMLVLVLWRLPLPRGGRWWLALGLVLAGVGGFAIRYAAYLQSGATSAAARAEYWRVAWEVTRQNPLSGSGPGTFAVVYVQHKTAGAEMTRLVHNDYLEQASDAGLPAAAAYLLLWCGSLIWLQRRGLRDSLRYATWLGLVGWALQGVVEFGLYLPALSWNAFLLLGWLWGTASNRIDTPSAAP